MRGGEYGAEFSDGRVFIRGILLKNQKNDNIKDKYDLPYGNYYPFSTIIGSGVDPNRHLNRSYWQPSVQRPLYKAASMFGKFQVGFEHPWMLLLLVLIPVSWYLANRSLSGLGQARKLLALIFRSLVLLLITLALAGIQWIWISDRQTVI